MGRVYRVCLEIGTSPHLATGGTFVCLLVGNSRSRVALTNVWFFVFCFFFRAAIALVRIGGYILEKGW